MKIKSLLFLVLVLISLYNCRMKQQETIPGIFQESANIGELKFPGDIQYDSESEVYTLKGSGTNMWYDQDEFFFVWRKLKGNMILSTQINFVGEGADPHRKTGIIIRESLEPGSPYVSAAYHGDGLVSMQYRSDKDSATFEFRASGDSLPVLQLINYGETVSVQAAKVGKPLEAVGELEVSFTGDKEYYVGLFICSHNPDIIEESRFLNTRLSIPASDDFIPYTDYIGSRLEILDIESGMRKIVFESDLPIEAPNWSRDGKYFVVNAGGLLYRIPVGGGEAKIIDTDFANSNNNDHGISPDGTQLVISHHDADREAGENSVIYTLPIDGGIPKQITQNSPSYWHGWSPDGKDLIYTAKRDGIWGIFKVSIETGDEIQLTNNSSLDDGSEYTPDGQHIWFNSNRTGSMEIWRMKEDGSEQTQITDDNYQNWFAHESPNRDKLILLSYLPDVDLFDHPYYKQVMLRIIDLKDGVPTEKPKVIAYLYGGQGTINVHSWSPDGTKLAFVSNSSMVKK